MFASCIDNEKVSSAIMTTLTRGDYTKATLTTLSTYVFPVITGINGKATADDQNGFTKEMYVQRIPHAIYAWEQGKNAPTIDNLLVLSYLFDVNISEIVVSSNIEIKIYNVEKTA